MRTKIFTLITLLVLWFGLIGCSFEVNKVLFGLVVPIIAYLFAIKFGLIPQKIYLNYHSLLYFFWLIKEILKSNIAVIKVIWRKNLELEPIFEWVDSGQRNEVGLVIYANSITLTPGTITIDVNNDKLLVHALEQSSINELKYGNFSMGKRIRGMLR